MPKSYVLRSRSWSQSRLREKNARSRSRPKTGQLRNPVQKAVYPAKYSTGMQPRYKARNFLTTHFLNKYLVEMKKVAVNNWPVSCFYDWPDILSAIGFQNRRISGRPDTLQNQCIPKKGNKILLFNIKIYGFGLNLNFIVIEMLKKKF